MIVKVIASKGFIIADHRPRYLGHHAQHDEQK